MFLVWFLGVKIHARFRSLDVIRDECNRHDVNSLTSSQATDEEAEKYYKVLKISQGSGEVFISFAWTWDILVTFLG